MLKSLFYSDVANKFSNALSKYESHIAFLEAEINAALGGILQDIGEKEENNGELMSNNVSN